MKCCLVNSKNWHGSGGVRTRHGWNKNGVDSAAVLSEAIAIIFTTGLKGWVYPGG